MNDSTIEETVASYSDRMHALSTEISLAQWELATTGSEEVQPRLVELEMQHHQLFQSDDDFRQVESWRREKSLDHDLARQVEHLYLSFLANREDPELARQIVELQASIEMRFMNFRGQYRGQPASDNELRQVLTEERDSAALREAWEASKQVGSEVWQDVIKLARLRNEAARATRYRDYFAQSLALQELDEDELFEVLERLEHLTDEPFARVKSELDRRLARRFGIDASDLRPWHYGDPFFQEVPPGSDLDLDRLYIDKDLRALAHSTFEGLGMQIDDILERSDLYERERKNQHAFCMHVDRLTDDVRMLCNLRPNHLWMGTLLHELGHAVYDKYLGVDLPYLLREAAHISTTEAMAMLFGRLTSESTWLRQIAGAPAEWVEQTAGDLKSEQALGLLVFMRWGLVMVHFERELYRDPERADLNDLWWQLVQRLQRVTRPEGRNEPDWAAKIHVALYPAYYQNYILGELTASQVQRWLEREAGAVVGSPDAGRLLRSRLFELGSRYPWNETLRRVTGEQLRPEYFAEQFVH